MVWKLCAASYSGWVIKHKPSTITNLLSTFCSWYAHSYPLFGAFIGISGVTQQFLVMCAAVAIAKQCIAPLSPPLIFNKICFFFSAAVVRVSNSHLHNIYVQLIVVEYSFNGQLRWPKWDTARFCTNAASSYSLLSEYTIFFVVFLSLFSSAVVVDADKMLCESIVRNEVSIHLRFRNVDLSHTDTGHGK